jgi:hypothetical protein
MTRVVSLGHKKYIYILVSVPRDRMNRKMRCNVFKKGHLTILITAVRLTN